MTDNVIAFPTKEDIEKRFEGVKMYEWVFTNEKDNPYPHRLLHAFYDGVFKNRVGVMTAKVKGTDQIHTLLVGVEVDEEGNVSCYPLAKILSADEHGQYLAPTGDGEFIEDGGD